jgi:hypothetical protein
MRTPIPWNTDQFGRILGPRFHDGRLTGLQFSDGHALNLQIRNSSGEAVKIELLDITDINIAQLCNGAIISDVYLWKVDSVPEAWSVPDSAWNMLFAERYGSAGAKEKASKIARDKPESMLVQVECSYGGAIAAICSNVGIFKESTESV